MILLYRYSYASVIDAVVAAVTLLKPISASVCWAPAAESHWCHHTPCVLHNTNERPSGNNSIANILPKTGTCATCVSTYVAKLDVLETV